tara:strand:+ start:2290 stop:3234 length:945 start_codon:yes stop_codon:yes gene_type:complete
MIINFKFLVILFIKILFVFTCFYYLLNNNFVDFSVILPFLFKDIKILIVLFCFTLFTIIIATIRWHLILKSLNFKIDFRKVLEIVYIGTFFNNLLIGGYGGDALRVYYIFNASEEKKLSLSLSVLVDRLIGFLGLSIIGTIFLFQILNITEIYEYLIQYINIYIIILILLLICSFYIFNSFKKVREILIKFFNYLLNNKIIFCNCLILSIILFSIVNYSVYIISDYIFNFEIYLKQIFFSNSVTVVMNSLPITPGGFGIGELSFVKLNNLFIDNNKLVGLANVIIYFRIVNFIVSFPAIIFYLRYKNKYYSFNK